MSNLYDIVALIGGQPTNIQQFINTVKYADLRDENNLISSFKLIKLYDDLFVFSLGIRQCNWFDEEDNEETWWKLCGVAESQSLSWVSYRACTHCQNVESRDDNGNKKYFDNRLLNQSYSFWLSKYLSYSDVAIAIGSKPDVIKNFIEILKQECNETIYQKMGSFQMIDIEDDLTIFTYLKRNCLLDYSKLSTWQNLCKLANRHCLSWVFYRDSESFIGAKEYSNNNKYYFDTPMLQLFEIENRTIYLKHPKLAILD